MKYWSMIDFLKRVYAWQPKTEIYLDQIDNNNKTFCFCSKQKMIKIEEEENENSSVEQEVFVRLLIFVVAKNNANHTLNEYFQIVCQKFFFFVHCSSSIISNPITACHILYVFDSHFFQSILFVRVYLEITLLFLSKQHIFYYFQLCLVKQKNWKNFPSFQRLWSVLKRRKATEDSCRKQK